MARILIIDDEKSIRDTLLTVLQREGHEVALAENGELGIREFRAAPFDLVITDIVMPDKEGLETVTELRSISSAVKIIVISGGGRSGNTCFLDMALKLGADSALPKPFSRANLLDAVDDCLSA